MKKGLKIFLIILGILIGLILIVNIVAGPVVKAYAEKHSEELCHRKATIKHVRINLLTGKVAVIGLNVKEENGKEKFMSFDKLKVRVSLPRLLGKKVRINKIMLNGLDAKVIQDGIRFNFSDIIDFYTKDRKPKPKKKKGKWTVDIHNIHVKNSAVLYEDKRMGSKFDTKDVNIKVPHLKLKQGSTRVNMTTAFRNGGDFALKGGYDIHKGDFDAKVNMHELPLSMAWPYLRHVLNVGSLSGKLKGDASVKGCVKHITDMVFSGTAGLSNFKAVNKDKSPLLSFSSFDMNLEKGDLGKKDFKIKEVALKDLVVNFDVFEDGTTISRLRSGKSAAKNNDSAVELVETAESAGKTAKSSGKSAKSSSKNSGPAVEPAETAETSKKPNLTATKYLVKKLLVSNGKIVYADHSVSPQAQNFEVSGLDIQADNLSNNNTSPIKLKAKLGTTGELACNARINPFDLKSAAANVSIKNLSIKDFNPYSLYYLAYPVEDGLLEFSSDVKIQNNWLESQNMLDIYKPAFGKKDKSIKPAAAKIPMKAAMYVITDRKGHAKMELPVTGDVSSPEFSFRKVIWKTFLNLVVKIAASPVDFIAKAVAGDETFKPITLAVDAPKELTIEHVHQLNAIADYLKEKQEMDLEIFLTPHADAGLNAKRESELKQQWFQLMKNHLVKQGIPANRVLMMNEKKEHKSKGNLKIDFNLKYEEE